MLLYGTYEDIPATCWKSEDSEVGMYPLIALVGWYGVRSTPVMYPEGFEVE